MNDNTFLSDLHDEVARRRTFAIISHPDAGKTTLTEKLLLFGGAIQMAGTVKAKKSDRHATSDWMEVEKQRGISVASSVMQFEFDGCVVNLLDTPGHEDFSEDTYRVLTAVDAALMVIDAAKGVEERTIKLMEVCRMRDTPIITFINKMDREVREPVELLDEIEKVLDIHCAPITWPVGMGKGFKGVLNLKSHEMLKFAPGQERADQTFERITAPSLEALAESIGMSAGTFIDDVELVGAACPEFDQEAFQAGRQTPVFFGSAINNFGVREILQALVDWAPSPQPHDATTRAVSGVEKAFTGFVFKIQANMDPQHRDRIAFLRVCSGKYEPGIKVKNQRAGKELRIQNAVTFLANTRARSEEAFAGDIIGIHNHGQLQIGDTLADEDGLSFTGIPYFAPELFRSPRLRDPLKAKQLYKGLKELGEEGAVQVFEPYGGGSLLIGAVGPLQFEIVSERLKSEYGVDAFFEQSPVVIARWVTCADAAVWAEFEKTQAARLGKDVDDNWVYLVSSRVYLQTAAERFPKVKFHATREHGKKLAG
ncbi:MAG TPA: peptide chain release factor 3 [Rhodocyclaceae bacterium]|nr:peptide chain release factor 3 [Rhodocyclaceae bacterium]